MFWYDNFTTYSCVAFCRGVDLVAPLLLKLILAAVAALPPPKALGLQVSKRSFELRVVAVLDGLFSQCVGEGPKPGQWPGLGWVVGTGKVLVHDGALELGPESNTSF